MHTTDALSCCSDSWYLVHCKARKEAYASGAISNILGIAVFSPEYRASSKREKLLPFFPGYIFVQANLQKVPASRINSCPGVIRLVEFSEGPQPVPHRVVEEIYCQLDRYNKVDQPCFSSGDSVCISYGPLKGLEMIFVGPTTPSKRVHVLLHFLGRLKEVYVEAEMLKKVPKIELSHKEDRIKSHKRYTRGKGRRIALG